MAKPLYRKRVKVDILGRKAGDIIESFDIFVSWCYQGAQVTYDLRNTDLFESVPEFQAGDYIHGDFGQSKIRRLVKCKIRSIWLDWSETEEEGYQHAWYLSSIRKATAQEIEDYLIAEAKKRGFVKGVYVDNSNLGCTWKGLISRDNYRYIPEQDILAFAGAYIYQNGQWANIIPQKPTQPSFKIGLFDVKIEKPSCSSTSSIPPWLGGQSCVSIGCKTFTVDQVKEVFHMMARYDMDSFITQHEIVYYSQIKEILDLM